MWRRRRSFCRQNMFIFRSNFSQIPMHHNSYYYDILPAINLSTLSPKIFAQFILIEQLRSSFGFTSKQPATLPSHLIIPLNKTAICPARNSQPASCGNGKSTWSSSGISILLWPIQPFAINPSSAFCSSPVAGLQTCNQSGLGCRKSSPLVVTEGRDE